MRGTEPQNRFTRRERAEAGSIRLGAFVFLGMVASIGWLYVVFVSDAFMIKDIQVEGIKSLENLEVKREVYQLLDEQKHPVWQSPRHFWFINETALAEQLKERLFAEQVKVEKAHKNILRLIIQERHRRIILHTPTQFVWIDTQGTILEEATMKEAKEIQARLDGKPSTAIAQIPIIGLPESSQNLIVGERSPISDIRPWLDIGLQLQKEGINYREMVVAAATSTGYVRIKSMSGYEIWLDTYQETLKKQIDAYKAFEKSKPKDTQVKEYVDVRIPNKVYVK